MCVWHWYCVELHCVKCILWYIYNVYLVRGAITIVKNDGVRQWLVDDIPCMKWKIIQMFETTNQVYIFFIICILYAFYMMFSDWRLVGPLSGLRGPPNAKFFETRAKPMKNPMVFDMPNGIWIDRTIGKLMKKPMNSYDYLLRIQETHENRATWKIIPRILWVVISPGELRKSQQKHLGWSQRTELVGDLQDPKMELPSVPAKNMWNPRCSMYGIFTDIGLIFGVNVGKYSIHGAYGNRYLRPQSLPVGPSVPPPPSSCKAQAHWDWQQATAEPYTIWLGRTWRCHGQKPWESLEKTKRPGEAKKYRTCRFDEFDDGFMK